MRSLITKTARKISRIQAGPFMEGTWKEQFLKIDKRWGKKRLLGNLPTSGQTAHSGLLSGCPG